MKKEERTEIKLKENQKIPYIWKTLNLGRAEFQICAIWKRGRVKKVFIYPRQQENIKHFYSIEPNSTELRFHSWKHKGVENPECWLISWCKEHKCQSYAVYVPPFTDHFYVTLRSVCSIVFDNESIVQRNADYAITQMMRRFSLPPGYAYPDSKIIKRITKNLGSRKQSKKK